MLVDMTRVCLLSLAVDKSLISSISDGVNPTAKWEGLTYSRIAQHDAACCVLAREWMIAFDFAQLNGGELTSGPRWLRARYEWGPSEWPIYWCDAVNRKTLDCGALAWMAYEIFTARGLLSLPAQFVQRYNHDATSEWAHKWAKKGMLAPWIDGELIYHEGAALLMGPEDIKLFDPSAGWWLNLPTKAAGYGSLVAVRLFDSKGRDFRWGEHVIRANRWHRFYFDRTVGSIKPK